MGSAPFDAAIWLCIFEKLYEGPTKNRDVKAVMLVCKAWNVLATPVLYRTIYIPNRGPTCEKLIDCLAYADFNGKSHAEFIRHVSFCATDARHGLLALASLLQNLQTFHCIIPASHSVLQPLSRWSAMTMRSMEVTFAGEVDRLALATGLLGRMKNLRCLNLELMIFRPLNSTNLISIPAVTLPWLEEFTCRTTFNETTAKVLGNYLKALAHSDFPSLRRLSLLLLSESVGELCGLGMKAVLSLFFLRHGAQLQHLTLTSFYGVEEVSRVIGTLPFAKMETLEFKGQCTHGVLDAFLRRLPATVQTISLEMPSFDNPGDQDNFWKCLDAIARAVSDRVARLKSVSLLQKEGFAWTDISQLDPLFGFRLFVKAVALAALNVTVFDSTGKKGLQLLTRD